MVEIRKPHGFDSKYSSELTEILPEDREATRVFKEISMIETKNINRAKSVDELLSIRHVTGEYLLQLGGSVVSGFLMDLGSGVLGYVSNTVLLNIASRDQLADVGRLDKQAYKQLLQSCAKQYEVVDAATFVGKDALSAIMLGDYRDPNEIQGVSLGVKVGVLVPERHGLNRYRVIRKQPDYVLFESTSGSGLVILHCTDAGADTEKAIAQLEQFQVNQLVSLDAKKIRPIPEGYKAGLCSSLTDSEDVHGVLESFTLRSYQPCVQGKFCYVSSAEVKYISNSPSLEAVVSFTQPAKGLPLFGISDGLVKTEDLPQLIGYQNYRPSNVKNSNLIYLEEQRRHLPSRGELQVGDIIPGYYVSQKAECVFMFQVSEQVSIAVVKKDLPEEMPLYMPLMFRIVDVRGSRIYGSPSKYMLGSTFCTRDKLALK